MQAPAEGEKPQSVSRVVRAFFAYAGGYWRNAGQGKAVIISILLALVLLGRLAVDFGVNTWNRYFFDALGGRDTTTLTLLVWAFLGLVIGMVAVGAAIVYLRETIQVEWRRWLTEALLRDWLAGATRAQSRIENPEYRISDDVRLATEPMIDFIIALFSSLLAAALFIGVLWRVGGDLPLEIGGTRIVIPAYFVLSAVAYAITVNVLMPLVGWRLTPAMEARNEAEARFRFDLIGHRALRTGTMPARMPSDHGAMLRASYWQVFTSWQKVIVQHVRLTCVSTSNSALAPVVPLFLGIPGIMSGRLTLGEVVQLSLAFVQVQTALGWFAENYLRLAEWRASALRILWLVDASSEPSPSGREMPAALAVPPAIP